VQDDLIPRLYTQLPPIFRRNDYPATLAKDETHRLPRFNMPLELGLFLRATKFGEGGQENKRCLILDRESYRYQKYISDIAGQDIKSHDDRPEVAIRKVRDWFDSSPVDTLEQP
jgi:hypothetical protein